MTEKLKPCPYCGGNNTPRSFIEAFDAFMTARTSHAREKLRQQSLYEAIADSLKQEGIAFTDSLSKEQASTYARINDYRIQITALIDEYAYRQGLSDGIRLMAGL